MYYKIYCKPSPDHSEFTLIAERDDEIVFTQTYYCFEDVLIFAYDFLENVKTTFRPESRIDTIEVNLNYIFV